MTIFTYNLLNILIGLHFLLQNYCEEKTIVYFLNIKFFIAKITYTITVSENDLFLSNQFSNWYNISKLRRIVKST